VARQIWLQKTFRYESAQAGYKLWIEGQERGLSMADALRYAGYVTEQSRQGGYPDRYTWTSLSRSGHRYARGRNSDNYLNAGVKMVVTLWQYKYAEVIKDRHELLALMTATLNEPTEVGFMMTKDMLSDVLAEYVEYHGLQETHHKVNP
jgi:hypothetical protein